MLAYFTQLLETIYITLKTLLNSDVNKFHKFSPGNAYYIHTCSLLLFSIIHHPTVQHLVVLNYPRRQPPRQRTTPQRLTISGFLQQPRRQPPRQRTGAHTDVLQHRPASLGNIRPRHVHTSTKDGLTNDLLHRAWQQRTIHVWIKCLRHNLRHSTAENPIFLQATHRRTWK